MVTMTLSTSHETDMWSRFMLYGNVLTPTMNRGDAAALSSSVFDHGVQLSAR